jgi:phage/plasmid-like protein (TIGR03299 family)
MDTGSIYMLVRVPGHELKLSIFIPRNFGRREIIEMSTLRTVIKITGENVRFALCLPIQFDICQPRLLQLDIPTNRKENNHMAHDIETQNGKASFASLREPAWHKLGTVFEDEKNTAEMLQAAQLDNWDVRLQDVEYPAPLVANKEFKYVIRTNPTDSAQHDVLGIVGNTYKPLQNEDLFSFGDNILDGGGRWETAGSLKGGRVVFGALALERETILDPSGVADKIKTYLLVTTSHDGSIAIQASVTPVRVVCANTLNVALNRIATKNGVKQSFKIRHTSTVEGKVQSARETLQLTDLYMDEFDVMAKAMFAKEVTAKDFFNIIVASYPKPDADVKGALTKWENKVDVINDIYTGEFNGMIAGNAWGAYNALTERLDWYRNPRGDSSESVLSGASGFDATINAEKARLLKVVKDVMQLA